MLSDNEKRILFSIKLFPIIIIVIFSSILTYTFVSQNHKNFKLDSKRIQKDFIQKNKELVKKDVHLVYDLINYEKRNTLNNLKNSIKIKIEEAYNIALNIYNNNKHLKRDAVIEKIKDALRYIRFNDGRGYYFIYGLNGKNILFPTIQKLEGENLWNLQDAKQNYTIRDLSSIVKEKEEGFHTWYWFKPNNNDEMFEKVGYVKLFKPFNIFIGTGEYIIDFENNVKNNILKRIGEIQYNKKSYVFIIDYKGVYINHIKKDLIGKDLFDLKDNNSVYLTREIIKTAQTGNGFVEYLGIPGTQVGKPTKKISYIKGFDDWGWAIGSGFYPQEMKPILAIKENELKNNTESTLTKIFLTVGLTTGIIITLLLMFTDAIKKRFEGYRARNKEYQEKLEKLLAYKTKKLSDSLETINSYVSMTKTDLKGIITYASDNFCKSVGYKRVELMGQPHSIVRHPDNKEIFYTKLWDTIKAGEIFKDTMKDLTKDGDDFWFEILIYPDYDENTKIIGYTALRIDITDRKRIEKINKNLEVEISKAVQSNRDKDYVLSQQSKMAAMGEMLQNIAHQWRQPLSVISTASSGMKLQKDFKCLTDEQFYQSVNNILNNTKYLSQTIDTFRDFFKSNKEKKLLNLKDVFTKTLKLVDSKYSNNEIEIISTIQEVEFVGLDSELMQVLMNILNNAKDAFANIKNQKKFIFVNITKDEYYAFIKIKDNAGGIHLNIINRIFDPYFTTKHKSQGTGIGLYMSAEIISKQMNGSINVQNQTYTHDGENYTGAEFILSIPLFEAKNLTPEILERIQEFSCYTWDKNEEKFLKSQLCNDKLVFKNISDITNLLYRYQIRSKVLENQDIQVYF